MAQVKMEVEPEEKTTYLAPRNWTLFQQDRKGQPIEGPQPWIKDFTNKENDYDYQQLTVMQRYILDGIRRLCGQLGKYPRNDSQFIGRSLAVRSQERHNVAAAIRQLTTRGLLIPVESSEWLPRVDKNREEYNISIQQFEREEI